MDSADLRAISADFVSLTSTQVRAIETDDLVALGTAGFGALGTAQLAALTTSQVDALTAGQVGTLDSDDIRAFTTAQLAGFTTSADIAAFSTQQIQAFTTQQLAALSTSQLQWLQTEDIVALTTDQVTGFMLSQIPSFTTDQVRAFQTEDLKALTATQAAAFTGANYNALNTLQRDALAAASPIVLDLDGNGVSTLAASDGVHFDLLGLGRQERVGWTDGRDGLLALDRDGDGRINDGSELFGVGTRLADGQRAGDGYQALAELDSHRDGRIDARDDRFGDLRLWVDGNRDGQTDVGELLGLVDLGITELDLSYVRSDRIDEGNLVGMVSSYRTADGQVLEMADVWFAKDRSADAAPAMSELLSEAPGSVPGVGDSKPGAARVEPAGGPALVTPAGVAGGRDPEDELRQSGPLV